MSSDSGSAEGAESLCLQVEFVKLNISRSCKLLFSGETGVKWADVPGTLGAAQGQTAVMCFSALCDIYLSVTSYRFDCSINYIEKNVKRKSFVNIIQLKEFAKESM